MRRMGRARRRAAICSAGCFPASGRSPTPLTACALRCLRPASSTVYAPFGTSTPLWYYILAEAKVAADGLHLGPVGGRIVTETLIGLLRADPTSYLSVFPRFRPFLGAGLTLGHTPDTSIAGDRTYTKAHFLSYARLVTPGTYR
jgi:hypothetical protein